MSPFCYMSRTVVWKNRETFDIWVCICVCEQINVTSNHEYLLGSFCIDATVSLFIEQHCQLHTKWEMAGSHVHSSFKPMPFWIWNRCANHNAVTFCSSYVQYKYNYFSIMKVYRILCFVGVITLWNVWYGYFAVINAGKFYLTFLKIISPVLHLLLKEIWETTLLWILFLCCMQFCLLFVNF
jgi:hypothetical protein